MVREINFDLFTLIRYELRGAACRGSIIMSNGSGGGGSFFLSNVTPSFTPGSYQLLGGRVGGEEKHTRLRLTPNLQHSRIVDI